MQRLMSLDPKKKNDRDPYFSIKQVGKDFPI